MLFWAGIGRHSLSTSQIVRFFKLQTLKKDMRYQVDSLLPLKLDKKFCVMGYDPKILLANQFAAFFTIGQFHLLDLIPVVYCYIVLVFIYSPPPPILAKSIFGNAALTRQSLRLLPFRNPTIGSSGKTFLCSLSGASKKFLQYTSDILKRWTVSDVKSKFTFRSSGVPLFKKAILRFTSCFEYVCPNHYFTKAFFLQPRF